MKTTTTVQCSINRVMFAYYPGKCSGSVCTTLTACMTDPSSSSCTGTYSAATTMPALATSVSLLQVTESTLYMSYIVPSLPRRV